MSAHPRPDPEARTLPPAGPRPAARTAVRGGLLAELAGEGEAAGAHCSAAAVARIGPNALIQTAAALREVYGARHAAALFEAAGLTHRLAVLPEAMVPEAEVIRLHVCLRTALGPQQTRAVTREAGRRTADYLLANRIPRPAQALLKLLPARASAGLLMRAVGRHAWTFAGSGSFRYRNGRPTRLEIADCPLCREIRSAAPVCDYYAATFERLFRVLVARDAYAVETACQAAGAAACRFELRY